MNEKELMFNLNPYDIISLITKYRKHNGLSIEKLAKLVDTSKSTLSRLEARETEKIDFSLVIKIKSVLNIPDDEILLAMNYVKDEKEHQNMTISKLNSDIAQCNICYRSTFDDRNIRLEPENLRELKLGYRNQCSITVICKACRKNLRDLLDKDLKGDNTDNK